MPGEKDVVVTPQDSSTAQDAGRLAAWMEVYSGGLFATVAGIAQLPLSKPHPDVEGIDWLVGTRSPLGIQLKSSYACHFNKKGTLQFKVKPNWVASWHRQSVPPRLVLYLLERMEPDQWCERTDGGEFHRVVPYWAVLDRSVSVPSVRIERVNRFTPETLAQWAIEIEQGMGGLP